MTWQIHTVHDFVVVASQVLIFLACAICNRLFVFSLCVYIPHSLNYKQHFSICFSGSVYFTSPSEIGFFFFFFFCFLFNWVKIISRCDRGVISSHVTWDCKVTYILTWLSVVYRWRLSIRACARVCIFLCSCVNVLLGIVCTHRDTNRTSMKYWIMRFDMHFDRSAKF